MSPVGKALLLFERFCNADPVCGESNSFHMLLWTLEDSRLAKEIRCFHFDERTKAAGRDTMQDELYWLCREWRPAFIVFTPFVPELQPSNELLSILRDELGIPIWLHMGETTGNHPALLEYLAVATGGTFWDRTSLPDYFTATGKTHAFVSPVSRRLFYDRGLPRDIDVSFIGTLWQNTQRGWYVEELRARGVPVCVDGGKHRWEPGFHVLSPEEYASLYCRSKLTLNFCGSGRDGVQLKGRPMEAMGCRAMLLNEDCEDARYWFEEGKEFVAFSSPDDLAEKIRHYLAHDKERERIADAGHRAFLERCDTDVMWRQILERLGLI